MKQYQSIAVAIQFDAQASTLLQAARQLSCQRRGCRLDLLHVCPHIASYGDVGNRFQCGRSLQLKQQLFPQLKQMAEPAGIAGHQIHILFGDVAETLSHYLRGHGNELCILGHKLNSSLHNLALGHVSSRILEDDCCDLLVLDQQQQQHWRCH